jgi:Flp pilus assembly protein TadD
LINLAFMHITVLPDSAATEDACRRLLAIDDEVANYHSLLGWAVAVQGRYEEAREILERALELEPEHPYALPNLGYVLVASGNPGSAVLYFRRNLDRIRRAGHTENELGGTIDLVTALSEAGDLDEVGAMVDGAERRLEEMRSGQTLSLEDHAALAQLNAVARRMGRAEDELDAALAMEVDGPNARFELARACAMVGRRECAIENTRLALEEGFDDPYLPMLIPSMHRLLGDPDFMALFEYPRGSSDTGE